jgi:DNA-binding transcriptional LysR family regulator
MPEVHVSPYPAWQYRHVSESIDLDLLTTLRELLATRSVTETARRTESTQPAVSRALARLRVRFGDPLLTRVGRRLEPTPFARELAPKIDGAVTAMRRVLEPATAFDPAKERGVLTLGASDYAIASFLGPFFADLGRAAPGLVTRVSAIGSWTVGELTRGDVQLAVVPRVPIEGIEGLVMKPLIRDSFVCALREGHPAARKRLTLARYLALDHVMVGNERQNPSGVQIKLRELGRARHVGLVLPSFLAVAAHVLRSDAVAVLPVRLVEATPGLLARPTPFTLAPYPLFAAWHPRFTIDARHRWLRERLSASIRA